MIQQLFLKKVYEYIKILTEGRTLDDASLPSAEILTITENPENALAKDMFNYQLPDQKEAIRRELGKTYDVLMNDITKDSRFLDPEKRDLMGKYIKACYLRYLEEVDRGNTGQEIVLTIYAFFQDIYQYIRELSRETPSSEEGIREVIRMLEIDFAQELNGIFNFKYPKDTASLPSASIIPIQAPKPIAIDVSA